MKIRKVKKTVTFPSGFWASGISCGIKKSGKKDMALLAAEKECQAVGMFTTSVLKAAPLKVSQLHLGKSIKKRAVLVTSGNANCATGKRGVQDSIEETKCVSALLGCRKEDVLVLSTGRIGQYLPMEKIRKGIPEAVRQLSSDGGEDFSKAILTTDTFVKMTAYLVGTKNRGYALAGTAKGAGMIRPDMATMLAFVTTDLPISRSLMKSALKEAVQSSFNRITIDGCMSTNDTVFLLSSGRAKHHYVKDKGRDYTVFLNVLKKACRELAEMIILDGEGMTKVIEISVKGAQSHADARKAAEAVGNSNLFKTAVYGRSPNWGRIFASLGSSKIKVAESRLSIKLCGLTFMKKGEPVFIKRSLQKEFKKKRIPVEVDLGMGKFGYRITTVDLTPEYIRINEG
ncbi:MAG: bifunctional glutamate N-acetyltransferase/amino-acid acetyltransferase ArgJ [Candidatus Aureabacteria bacterium]|nr:bifunctional glutamate N-acetyltransferase/amino-acid acetyltransferase ArgJ [Candidatus Auribacterota bacterium]